MCFLTKIYWFYWPYLVSVFGWLLGSFLVVIVGTALERRLREDGPLDIFGAILTLRTCLLEAVGDSGLGFFSKIFGFVMGVTLAFTVVRSLLFAISFASLIRFKAWLSITVPHQGMFNNAISCVKFSHHFFALFIKIKNTGRKPIKAKEKTQ